MQTGQRDRAHAILASPEYETLKHRYSQGMAQFITDGRTQLAQTLQQEKMRTMLALGLSAGLITVGLLATLVLLRRQLVHPLQQVAQAAAAIAAGNQTVPITSQDVIGTVQRGFNHMVRTIQQQTQGLHAQVVAAESARHEAERAWEQIAAQLGTIQDQQAVIRDMSAPILPLTESTLVMPLVGVLDTARLRLVQEQALQALAQTAVRHLILDVTGVPVIDPPVAQGLLHVMQATRLLGTKLILVGIRPEVAQTLVSLGIDLSQMTTASTLQSGVTEALGN